MSKARNSPASDWPSTPEIDGFTWELGPEDARWAAENLNDGWHSEELPPDDALEREADESTALNRLQNGTLL
jgi:hypothetical protein